MTIQDLGSLGEFVAAIATVATLVYLSVQIRASNRLARAEASRIRISEMNRLNASFASDPAFRAAFRRVISGSARDQIDPEARTLLDLYLLSATNIAEQLALEAREGVISFGALHGFTGAPVFSSPYYRSSWPLYRENVGSAFAEDFERRNGLDPSVEAAW